ncbi:cellulose biosynthesis protein BcsS [Methyloceanibacter sp.]|uniref:cellulose biosynthesis protein BcsS n=1 Tax=Methyloceanibacter sp. TaxID=1965321 RepID=UPI002D60022E|nr:cellulose biosynthesis protein BcsS [Methyloceanibacter sp.]HZP10306.1 cellulose biosynthesis protein BcsS [Methyloceanibacter sp.]
MSAMWGRCDGVGGAWLRNGSAGGLCLLASSLFAPPSLAQSDQPTAELFTGIEASDNYVSVYVGGGTALGKGLYEPGFRLRAVGSYGPYHYDGTLLVDGVYMPITFDGQDAFIAALAGYQFRTGNLIAKLFAGIEAEDQHISPHDPNNSVQGSEVGLRLALETWTDLSPRLFVSADASYGTAFQEYCALARIGFRVRPRLALGLEGGALGNEEYNAGKGGGFLRLDVRDIEFTLSGGFTGNYLEDMPSGYVSLGVYRAF